MTTLLLIGRTCSGDLTYLHVNQQQLTQHGSLAKGAAAHQGTVRCVAWQDAQNFVTGGEDARIVKWSTTASLAPPSPAMTMMHPTPTPTHMHTPTPTSHTVRNNIASKPIRPRPY